MNFSFPWPTVLSSVIVAAVSVLATIAYNRWAESRRVRFDCFRQMCRHGVDHNEFLKSFNEVPILFAKNKTVIEAHQKVLDGPSMHSEEMMRLLRAMANDLNVKGFSDKQLLSRFSSKT